MRSRTWMGIVVIGILGLALLGFMTKFAIESNSDLRDVIRFKTAFAEDFADSGIEEVSLRRYQSGFRMTITRSLGTHSAGPGDRDGGDRDGGDRDDAALDERIAEYFVRKFPDRAIRVLNLTHVSPGSFGCRSGEILREQEIALERIRQTVAIEERRQRMLGSLREAYGCELVSDRRDGRVLELELRVPETRVLTLEELATRIEPSLRAFFGGHTYHRLDLRLESAVKEPSSGPAGLDPGSGIEPQPRALEVSFDSRGQKVQR